MRPAEQSLWSTASPELMSDEEDGFRDGHPVWIVRPPAARSLELSALCQELQRRRPPGPRSKHRVPEEVEDTMAGIEDSFEDLENRPFTFIQL